jgi:ATP-binding cassette subfamily C protein
MDNVIHTLEKIACGYYNHNPLFIAIWNQIANYFGLQVKLEKALLSIEDLKELIENNNINLIKIKFPLNKEIISALPILILDIHRPNIIFKPAGAKIRLSSCNELFVIVEKGSFFREQGNHSLLSNGISILKPVIVETLTVNIILGLLSAVPPILFYCLLEFIIPKGNTSVLIFLTLSYAYCLTASVLLNLVKTYILNSKVIELMWFKSAKCFYHLLHLSTTFFRVNSSIELNERLLGIERIVTTLLNNLFTLPSSIIAFIINFLIMLIISVGLTIKLCIPLVLIASVTMILTKKMLIIEKQYLLASEKLSLNTFSFIKGISKIRCAGSEGQIKKKWIVKLAEQKRHFYKLFNLYGNINLLNEALLPISNLLIFVFLYIDISSDENSLKVSMLMTYLSAFILFSNSVIQLMNNYREIISVIPMLSRVETITNEIEESYNKRKSIEFKGNIELKNISFTQPGASQSLFNNISLRINQGEFIAITGTSGVGKSTLLKIILGLDKPDKGIIKFDGINIENLDVCNLRKQIGVVLQTQKLFSGTILMNITFATKLGYNDALKLAEIVGLDKDLKSMPMGLHTIITDNALSISGGQKQKIMLARALANNPKALMLDEATSALDNESQGFIDKNIARLGITRIVIAHRSSTLKRADKIYVLNNGLLRETNVEQSLY